MPNFTPDNFDDQDGEDYESGLPEQNNDVNEGESPDDIKAIIDSFIPPQYRNASTDLDGDLEDLQHVPKLRDLKRAAMRRVKEIHHFVDSEPDAEAIRERLSDIIAAGHHATGFPELLEDVMHIFERIIPILEQLNEWSIIESWLWKMAAPTEQPSTLFPRWCWLMLTHSQYTGNSRRSDDMIKHLVEQSGKQSTTSGYNARLLKLLHSTDAAEEAPAEIAAQVFTPDQLVVGLNGLLRIYTILAYKHMMRYNAKIAFAYAQQALCLAQRLGDESQVIRNLCYMASCLQDERPEQALRCLDEAQRRAITTHNHACVVHIHMSRAYCLFSMERYAEAIPAFERATEGLYEDGAYHWRAKYGLALSTLYHAMTNANARPDHPDVVRGIRMLESARERFAHLGEELDVRNTHIALTSIHLKLGEQHKDPEGETHVRQAADIFLHHILPDMLKVPSPLKEYQLDKIRGVLNRLRQVGFDVEPDLDTGI
jgi:tetratricopeptide (TPR) repeat protein